MNLRDRFIKLLKSSKTTRLLFILNIVVSLVIFILLRNDTGGDTHTYIGLADGILSGNYSYWHFLENPFPDTFRNPGYPLFLVFIRIFEKSIITIQIIQLLLYFFSIQLVLGILKNTFQRIEINNLFLIFLLPAVYMPIYTKDIFPEILVTFLILLSFRIQIKLSDSKIYKYVLLGLLYGFMFQVRPVFILVPVIILILNFFTKRQAFNWPGNILLLSVFILTMIPYGLWNKKNHGVFKITSLEGGGGV